MVCGERSAFNSYTKQKAPEPHFPGRRRFKITRTLTLPSHLKGEGASRLAYAPSKNIYLRLVFEAAFRVTKEVPGLILRKALGIRREHGPLSCPGAR